MGIVGNWVQKKIKQKKKNALIMADMSTYPTSFTLVFECFFGILCCRLDVIHCMLNMIFYAINHFALFQFSFVWIFSVVICYSFRGEGRKKVSMVGQKKKRRKI